MLVRLSLSFQRYNILILLWPGMNLGTLTPPYTWSCPIWICNCSFVDTTDSQSYITPIHDPLPDLPSYRI